MSSSTGFLTLRNPHTTAAEHRALTRRLLNGGYTSAELEARLDRRSAPANPHTAVDRMVAERPVTGVA